MDPKDKDGYRPGRESMISTHEPIEDILAGMGRNINSLLEEENGQLEAPPAYDEQYNQLRINQDGFDTQANITSDGRIQININEKARRLSSIFAPALSTQYSAAVEEDSLPQPPSYVPPSLGGLPSQEPPLPLNVVIHVVGSRGDVQPFVALGKSLKATYGHRVRLATHPTFKSFVEENGLEFFSIGGDPTELMAYMVRNPGLMPGMEALKSGDIAKRRRTMEEIVRGCWRSCFEAGDGISNSTQPLDIAGAASTSAQQGSTTPFIADAIIANPPSFAHIHIAEKMGIPLHMMFTMPWTPTQAFPHPLADIQSSNADQNMTNFVSYALVEMMTWQGLGDIINRFREKVLGLDPISMIWGPGLLHRLKVPFTYCWSPALIPKPRDWAHNISISGFYFLSLASSYRPDVGLAGFLASGPPPVYIGFGSIVVENPNEMTDLIFEAVKKAGVRALVSKGWGGLGGDDLNVPDGVYMLGNVPHDWLFEHVSCVVHHGGAGTTSAGIAAGKPTVVVPFFGDQPFWGAMVARAGAGPDPIPHAQLTADKLAAAIEFALKPETLEKAQSMGRQIRQEKGCEIGAKSFYDNLAVDDLRCSLIPNRVAVWRLRRTKTRLSSLAATVLMNENIISFSDLKLYRSREFEMDDGPWDPLTGGASALIGTMTSISMGVADVPMEIFKAMRSKKPKSTNGEGSNATLPTSQNASTTTLSSASSSDRHPSTTDLSSGQAAPDTPKSPQSERPQLVQDKGKAVSFDSAVAAGKGFGRIVGSGLKSPMDFSLGIARGFHNAPKLYGDTVRPLEKVDGLQSGLKAAGKGFGLGLYDGISGLVTQPVKGAQKEGAAGLVKGFGKGIGGLVLKPGAAIWALPGYTFMGINKEVSKRLRGATEDYITSQRITEGYNQWKSTSPHERSAIIQRWNQQKNVLRSSRQRVLEDGPEGQKLGRLSTKGFFETLHLSPEERKKLKEERRRLRTQGGLDHASSADAQLLDDDEVEDAIRASVAATSTGDPNEDQAIERAIRASLGEVQRAQESSSFDEQEVLNRAIQASVAAVQDSADEQHRSALEQSIQQSLAEPIRMSDDSEAMNEDMRRAIEESKASHAAEQRQAVDAKTEEEIVMAYIMKQSLAEEEHRRRRDDEAAN